MNPASRKARREAAPEWTALALQVGEMWLASAQVIAHRTHRIAAAGPLPGARDREEFSLMGREKVDATQESARAIAGHLAMVRLPFDTPSIGDWANGTAIFAAISEMSDSAARLFADSLAPLHARATENARRLGKN